MHLFVMLVPPQKIKPVQDGRHARLVFCLCGGDKNRPKNYIQKSCHIYEEYQKILPLRFRTDVDVINVYKQSVEALD